MDDKTRKLAIAFGASRIAYGVALLVAPGRAAGPWLGSAADFGGGRVAARALAVRDGAMGAGVIATATSGGPLRAVLAACVVSDLTDMGATLIDRKALPSHAAPGTIVVAGGMAAAGIALAASSD